MKNNHMLRLLLVLSVYFTSQLFGHTTKPAYLEIKAIGVHSYEIKWKIPLIDAKDPSISPIFPPLCQENILNTYKDSTMLFISSTLHCKEILIGKTISIQNIENDIRTVIFHFSENNTSYFSELNPTHPSLEIQNSIQDPQNTFSYISLGLEHILLGYDHLLFVLGLLLLIRKWKLLLQTITAFTLAHSITLMSSTLGYITVSDVFIEIMIALSIVILAVEIIYLGKGKVGLSSRYPWAIAFFFGLIHGFGFANVLAQLTLPKEHFIQALLFFNIGIELGQIAFIIFLISMYSLSKLFIKNAYLTQGKLFISYGLGSLASYWFIERLINSFNY
jgi:hydrogenase/urease accessory protein HupE